MKTETDAQSGLPGANILRIAGERASQNPMSSLTYQRERLKRNSAKKLTTEEHRTTETVFEGHFKHPNLASPSTFFFLFPNPKCTLIQEMCKVRQQDSASLQP